MAILLQVQHFLNQTLPQPLSGQFDASGGTLGRSADNLLVLDDPSKYISRVHAKIDFRDGGFYLTDVGSNPTLVNGRPLGRDRSILLCDADQLMIGDYQLLVLFSAQAQGLPPAQVSPIPAALHIPEHISLDDSLCDASILQVGSAPSGQHFDPLGMNLLATPKSAPQSATPAFRGAESDHIAPEIQSFQMPAVSHAVSPPAAVFDTPAALVQLIPDDYDPLADFFPLKVTASVTAPVAAEIQQAVSALSETKLQAAPALPADVKNMVAPVTVGALPKQSEPGVLDATMLQALLRGLGLPDLIIHTNPVEFAEVVGAMLRVATVGTMEVLRARAVTKHESRLEMTMIGSQANNPLKFFPNADSALTQLLSNTHNGYMTPVRSFINAFDDLKAHELATLAGMRAALGGVLARFDPATIEQRLQVPSVIDKMFAANRKAKLWDGLVELYSTMANEADDDFQRLFGEKFGIAYEEQIQRLRITRKADANKSSTT